MTKVIVFHYNRAIRDEIVNSLRNAGCVTYSANEPWQAWQAVQQYKPDAVITDFPAVIEATQQHRQTLTEAIRATPALSDVRIINVSEQRDGSRIRYAEEAGVTMSLPADRVAIVQAVCGASATSNGTGTS